MTNIEAIKIIRDLQKGYGMIKPHEALELAVESLEQMDRVKMVELKHIHQWAEDWKYDCCGRLSIEKLLGFFCKDHGILIEPKPVKKWIWQRVVQQGANSFVIHFLTERTTNKMSEHEISQHGSGWSQDLSTEIEE